MGESQRIFWGLGNSEGVFYRRIGAEGHSFLKTIGKNSSNNGTLGGDDRFFFDDARERDPLKQAEFEGIFALLSLIDRQCRFLKAIEHYGNHLFRGNGPYGYLVGIWKQKSFYKGEVRREPRIFLGRRGRWKPLNRGEKILGLKKLFLLKISGHLPNIPAFWNRKSGLGNFSCPNFVADFSQGFLGRHLIGPGLKSALATAKGLDSGPRLPSALRSNNTRLQQLITDRLRRAAGRNRDYNRFCCDRRRDRSRFCLPPCSRLPSAD